MNSSVLSFLVTSLSLSEDPVIPAQDYPPFHPTLKQQVLHLSNSQPNLTEVQVQVSLPHHSHQQEVLSSSSQYRSRS